MGWDCSNGVNERDEIGTKKDEGKTRFPQAFAVRFCRATLRSLDELRPKNHASVVPTRPGVSR